MPFSKPNLKLTLILLVLLITLLTSLKGATGLPWLVQSSESDGQVKEDKVRLEERKDIVNQMSDTLKQDVAQPAEEEDALTIATNTKTQPDSSQAMDKQESRSSMVEDRVGSHEHRQRNKLLTSKILKALRKERERKRQEKELLLHRLFLFEKPQTAAKSTSFQDFLNYFKGVGKRIKDFFTRHPVASHDSDSDDSILMMSQDLPVVEDEEESVDDAAQLQELEEALVQELLLLDDLKSAVKGGRERKRDANDRDVLLQVLNGLPFVMQSDRDLAHHSKNSDRDIVATLIAKDENSLPQLPTHGTALSILYTASSEDVPTMVPAIATTLNHPRQEQNKSS